jgi:hypothetical protein
MTGISLRAFLIDPDTGTVSEVAYEGGNHRSVSKVLGCASFEFAGLYNGDYMERGHGIYVNGDPIDEANPPKHYFEIQTAGGWTSRLAAKDWSLDMRATRAHQRQ